MTATIAQKYGTLLTAAGKTLIAAAVGAGSPIGIASVALGDANGEDYYPSETQEALRNQVYEAAPNSVSIDADNPNRIVVELFVPENVGGWTIREAAIKTDAGITLAVATTPATYKPLLAEGTAVGTLFKFILEVTNASVVTLKIDPSIVMASVEYVINAISNHANQTNVHGGTYAKTPNRLMLRNADGRCQVADPVEDADATPLGFTMGLINQFGGLTFVTQPEYDALPAGKLSDGKVYAIYEISGGGGGNYLTLLGLMKNGDEYALPYNAATQEEVNAGMVDDKYVTPDTLRGITNRISQYPDLSNRVNIAIGGSGTTYTAPNDGWVSANGTANVVGQYLALANSGSLMMDIHSVTTNDTVYVFIPVSKGDTATLSYSSSMAVGSFLFIPAKRGILSA